MAVTKPGKIREVNEEDMLKRNRMSLLLFFATTLSLLCGTACGQTERSELGKRLRRFELAWETADAASRKASMPVMQQAVSSFFSFQLSEAAKKLDEAWLTVAKPELAGWGRAALDYRIAQQPLIVDPAKPVLTVRLERFCYGEASVPDTATVEFQLLDVANKPVTRLEKSFSELQQGAAWTLEGASEGDYRICCRIVSDGASVELLPSTVSVIPDLPGRLDRIATSRKALPDEAPDFVRATVGELGDLLQSISEGQTPETDYPAHRIVEFCEKLCDLSGNPRDWIPAAASKDDVWLSLAEGRRKVVVRLRAPAITDVPMPVLFLFHGAGGSENMFFETCGAGRAVAEGLARGWLVVAPRQAMGGMALDCDGMIKSLEEIFPVDRENVFLLGHSMGAGQVIRQVSQNPQLASAAVAIGGGNRVRDPQAIAAIPWFIAAGEHDFGRRGAKALADSLAAAGKGTIEYREYPDIEHMVIVQAALDDCFGFLDLQEQVGDSTGDATNATGPAPVRKVKLGSTGKVHSSGEFYFSGQFAPEDIEALKAAGIRRVISLRTAEELEWDERAALENSGIEFVSIPFRDASSLTDEIFDEVRNQLAASRSTTTLLHCASSNRVGATWLAWRVLDEGVPLETAVAEARIVGLRSPALLEKTRVYLRKKQANRVPGATPIPDADEMADIEPIPPEQDSAPPQIRIPGTSGINDSFTNPDLNVDEWVSKFEIESREIYLAREEILAACEVQPGMYIADVGAGTGLFTRMFSTAAGDSGWVYAVEIAPRFIEHINRMSQDEGLTNITGVLGTQDSIALPPASVDLVFICDTYHHFENPPAILATIHRALKPGGHIVVVDFERIQGKTRDWVLNHVRGGKEVFRGEIEAAGFTFVEQRYVDKLVENYLLRFRKD
jgi:uncharacterized protein (TIGR01244 family)